MLGIIYCKKHLWDDPIKTHLKINDNVNLENAKDEILKQYYLVTQKCQLCSANKSWYEPVECTVIGIGDNNNVS